MTTQAAVSITIGAQLGSSFNGTFGNAQKQLNTIGSAIKRLNNDSANIKSYRILQKDTLQASREWKAAQANVKQLAAEIKKADKPSKELQKSFRQAQKEASLAKSAYQQNKNALRAMGSAMQQTGIDTKNLANEQNRLGKALETLEKRQRSVAKIQNMKLQNLAKRSEYRAQIADTVALGASLYATVRPAVDFELAMAKVGAITNESATSEGFKKLTALSRELGRSTQYTASEAAEAMQYLGMAGFNTQQILAATPAALNLAIAGNMDLGRTADIASNILTGFNLKAEETTHVADVLAQTSRSTNVNVEMLGETMKYVAPAAAAVGGTLEETAALAGVLGDAGIQATMAGTMLRAAYLRLAAPAKQGAEAIRAMGKELGISAEDMPEVILHAGKAQKALKGMNVDIFDKNGKMRSMVDILKDMNTALKGVSDKEKLSAVKAIFGDRAASGALAIFKHIETGRLDEVLQKTHSADGAAQEMADRLKSTTHGAWKEFMSAVESVGISLGSVLLPAFSDIFRTFATGASKISAFAEQYPILTKYIGLTIAGLISLTIATIGTGYAFTFLKGGVLGFISVFSRIMTVGAALIPIIKAVGIVFLTTIRTVGTAMLTNPIGLIITGIAVGAVLLIKYWKPISAFFKNLFTPVITVFKKVWNWIVNLWNKSKEIFESIKTWVADSIVGKAWKWAFGDDTDEPSANDNKKSVIGETIKENNDFSINSDSIPLEPTKLQSVNNSQQVNINAPINIHAAPGMNTNEIAAEVEKQLFQREQDGLRRRRSANYD